MLVNPNQLPNLTRCSGSVLLFGGLPRAPDHSSLQPLQCLGHVFLARAETAVEFCQMVVSRNRGSPSHRPNFRLGYIGMFHDKPNILRDTPIFRAGNPQIYGEMMRFTQACSALHPQSSSHLDLPKSSSQVHLTTGWLVTSIP